MAFVAQTFDAIVIGAGPAGLSAAAELSREGSCLLVEQGPPARERQRNHPANILNGVGGAGLFSDGKHSFFPSATRLWELPDRAALAGAFEETARFLRAWGVDAGALPAEPAPSPSPGGWTPKPYPSLYVPFDARLGCIDALWRAAGEARSGVRIFGAGRAGREIVLEAEAGELRTKHVVFATGRWSPRLLRLWALALGVEFEFQRVELGVRLEAAAGDPFFARLPGVDGKLVFLQEGTGLEIRTFCTCRDGEVVLGSSDALSGYSGRADGPRTGRSNVGLVVRTRDPEQGARLFDRLQRPEPCSFPLRDWPGPLPDTMGVEAVALLSWAIEQLGAPNEAIVWAPCIEGIGEYPIDDGNLRVAPGVHVAGDAIGRFRGIVASMISGRYAARRISQGAN